MGFRSLSWLGKLDAHIATPCTVVNQRSASIPQGIGNEFQGTSELCGIEPIEQAKKLLFYGQINLALFRNYISQLEVV
ncbi:hypothetical protein V3C99_006311 [Haemonchus contortus]